MKNTLSLAAVVALVSSLPATAAVLVTGVNSNTNGDYGTFASATDLVNVGAPTFLSTSYSSTPSFPAAPAGPSDNNGIVGGAEDFDEITFWLGAVAGDEYAITYALDTSSNTLGYDINSIQTINGFRNNSGNQGNQNYVVAVSTVGSAGFADIATVAFLPFTDATITGGYSSKVDVTEDVTGILASGVDEIRFTYTVPTSSGSQPSPVIREIDVFGVATVPEPSSFILCSLGLATLLIRRRCR